MLDLYTSFILLIVLIITTLVASVKYSSKKRGITDIRTPILTAYYTDRKGVVGLGEGKIGDLYFTSFLIGESKVLIYRIDLPYASKIHLLSIPKIRGGIQLDPSKKGSIMTKVDLEGDYYKYFNLYAPTYQQMEARYVLDPKAMAFNIDFCRAHNWELIDNELIMLQDLSLKTDDPTVLFADIQKFVEEIRPAVEIPLTQEQIKLATPYGKDRRTDLVCPICSDLLINKGQYFACPNNEGILINGRYLMDLDKGTLKIDRPYDAQKAKNHQQIKCPSCGHMMHKVAYKLGK